VSDAAVGLDRKLSAAEIGVLKRDATVERRIGPILSTGATDETREQASRDRKGSQHGHPQRHVSDNRASLYECRGREQQRMRATSRNFPGVASVHIKCVVTRGA